MSRNALRRKVVPVQERGKEVANIRFQHRTQMDLNQERSKEINSTTFRSIAIPDLGQGELSEEESLQDDAGVRQGPSPIPKIDSDFTDDGSSDESPHNSDISDVDESLGHDHNDDQYDDDWLNCVKNIRHGQEFSQFLKSNENKLKNDQDGNTLLHIAAYENNSDIFGNLLDKYPDKINEKNNRKKTPLHIAAKLNKDEFAKKLIEKRADVNIKDKNNFTPLLTAIRHDSLEVFKLLANLDEENSRTLQHTNLETDYDMHPLQVAAKYNSEKVAAELLQKHIDIENIKQRNGNNLVYLATDNNSDKVLKILLEKNSSETFVNGESQIIMTEGNGQPPAERDHTTHSCLFSPNNQERNKPPSVRRDCTTNPFSSDNQKLSLRYAKLYLKIRQTCNNGDNDTKELVKTPLHIAAQKGYLSCLDLLITKGRADLYRKCESGRTALHLAATKGNIRAVETLLKYAPELSKMKDASRRTALYHAIKHVKIVELLITSGAKVNNKDKHGRTPLSYAAEKGLLECTMKLIENKANINQDDNEKMKPIHYAAVKGQTEVFRVLLLKTTKEELESSHWNCLDLAIDEKQEEIAFAIFQMVDPQKTDKWKIFLRSRSKFDEEDPYSSKGSFNTPMRKLIRKMPDVARVVFDKCTYIKSKDKDTFEVVFDYEFLDDVYELYGWRETKSRKEETAAANDPKNPQQTDNVKEKTQHNYATQRAGKDSENNKDDDKKNKRVKGKRYTKDKKLIKSNHPLMIMVKFKQSQLLDHPLVSALLKKKWMSIGLVFNIVNFFLYLAFLVLLTGFALDVRPPYQFSRSPSYTVDCADFEDVRLPKFARYAQPGVVIMAGIVILIEIIEIVQIYSWKIWLYFLELDNLLEWITCTTAIIFVVDVNGCRADFGYKPPLQWICGTISVFCAWINMLFIIKKSEWFGIYVVMLYRILKMFTMFYLVFSLLIVAFAISFHCLFQNQKYYSTFWISLMRTTSMMIGGPDFAGTLLDETVHYEKTSYAFFYIFMLLMTVVVINLLVGLAVSNIQEFQKKANIAKKQMQVQFALELERIATSRFILKSVVKKLHGEPKNEETLKPNKQHWLQMKFAESWRLTERHINAALNTEKDENTRVVSQLGTKMKGLEATLETRMNYVDTQLAAILDKMNSLTAERN